jgi:hypothetical protein
MPLFLIPIALLLALALVVLSLPLSIVQRYRMSTARRPARPWVAALNAAGVAFSAALFLVTAAIATAWVPNAFGYSVGGLAGGLALGWAGVALTRWEVSSRSLYYTPNRWLVLSITLAAALRLCFGFWRAWHAWHTTPAERSWLADSGFAGSMAAGAVLLGYYLAFWSGVWRRVVKHRSKAARSHDRMGAA